MSTIICSSIDDISFVVPVDAVLHIRAILKRAGDMDLLTMGWVNHEMDLRATHANGMPMDFQRLREADDFTFVHDFCGIARHIDRQTGRLDGHFVPRCHAPLPASEVAS